MSAVEYLRRDVTAQSVTCDVLEDTSNRDYGGGGFEKVTEADVAIFAPSSSSEVVVEGSGQETSYTGLLAPTFDSNGDLTHVVEVNHRLEPQNTQQTYEVRVKEGLPNDLDVELWRLGLDRANTSE